jgi:hypothetical protein
VASQGKRSTRAHSRRTGSEWKRVVALVLAIAIVGPLALGIVIAAIRLFV